MNQVIHRDIKGANVLVDLDGVCKMADFGCAKKLSGNGGLSQSIGTINWMSPEVVKGEVYGRSADIWSLGSTVFEMLNGNPPWSEYKDDHMLVMNKIVEFKKWPELSHEISNKHLKDFIKCCWVTDPKKRWNVYKLRRHKWFEGMDPDIYRAKKNQDLDPSSVKNKSMHHGLTHVSENAAMYRNRSLTNQEDSLRNNTPEQFNNKKFESLKRKALKITAKREARKNQESEDRRIRLGPAPHLGVDCNSGPSISKHNSWLDRSKDRGAEHSCIVSQISIDDSVISTFSKPQLISNRGNQGSLRHNSVRNPNPQNASQTNLMGKSYRKTSTIGNHGLRLTKPSIYLNNVGFPNDSGSCDFSSSEEDQSIAPKRASPSNLSRQGLPKADTKLSNTVSTNYWQNPTARKPSGNLPDSSHNPLSKLNSLNSSLQRQGIASHKNIIIPTSTNDTNSNLRHELVTQRPNFNSAQIQRVGRTPAPDPKKRRTNYEKKFSESQISSKIPKEFLQYSNSVLLGSGGVDGLRACQWDSISNGISSPGHHFGINNTISQCQVESDEVSSCDNNFGGAEDTPTWKGVGARDLGVIEETPGF